MPKYNFINKDTNETYELWCSIAEMEQHTKDNPNVEQVIGVLNIGDPVRLGITRPPIDFQKHVLGKVKEMPGANKSVIEKRWVCPKEI